MPSTVYLFLAILREQYLWYCLYVGLVEDMKPSTVPNKKPLDVESDISDVEKEGYCRYDSNPVMSMRLERVKKTAIKELYRNTEKVNMLCLTLLIYMSVQSPCVIVTWNASGNIYI